MYHSDKHRRGRLVNWVEKAGLENIRQLLEIMEAERNHELLLTVKNLRELGGNPFPYIIPIVLRSLPIKVIEGEHFILLSTDSYSRGPNGGRCKDLSEVYQCFLASESTGCPLTCKEGRDEGQEIKGSPCQIKRFFKLYRIGR